MSWKNIIPGLLCIDFAILTIWTLAKHGANPVVWFEQLGGDLLAICLVADLLIALGVAVVWMVRDARTTGRQVWGYVALTVFTGSVGPLLYLALRPNAKGSQCSVC